MRSCMALPVQAIESYEWWEENHLHVEAVEESQMSSSLLEQTRSLHEDIEVVERAMYQELGDPANSKLKRVDTVARDQVVSAMLAAHQSRCAQVFALHEDQDGSRRDEINAMSGSGVFSSFYDQLKTIREYHRKHAIPPQTESYERQLLTEVLEGAATEQSFTGEEAEGKTLDMHELHEMCVQHARHGVATLAAEPDATACAGTSTSRGSSGSITWPT